MVMEDVRYNNHTLVNTGYYHRYFKTLQRGAMGSSAVHRGYSDANLFVAQTSHPQVAPMSVEVKSMSHPCHLYTCHIQVINAFLLSFFLY